MIEYIDSGKIIRKEYSPLDGDVKPDCPYVRELIQEELMWPIDDPTRAVSLSKASRVTWWTCRLVATFTYLPRLTVFSIPIIPTTWVSFYSIFALNGLNFYPLCYPKKITVSISLPCSSVIPLFFRSLSHIKGVIGWIFTLDPDREDYEIFSLLNIFYFFFE